MEVPLTGDIFDQFITKNKEWMTLIHKEWNDFLIFQNIIKCQQTMSKNMCLVSSAMEERPCTICYKKELDSVILDLLLMKVILGAGIQPSAQNNGESPSLGWSGICH